MNDTRVKGLEREYSFLGRMDNPDELKNAMGYEDQEQWRVFLPKDSNPHRSTFLRVRKSVVWAKRRSGFVAAEPVYVMTVKSFVKGHSDIVEEEVTMNPVSGEMLMTSLREISTDKTKGDGLIKRRYVFPVAPGSHVTSDMFWEVDVFAAPGTKGTGAHMVIGPYVKLDLEVSEFNIPHSSTSFGIPFPITMSDVVYEQPRRRSPTEEARAEAMFSKYMRA